MELWLFTTKQKPWKLCISTTRLNLWQNSKNTTLFTFGNLLTRYCQLAVSYYQLFGDDLGLADIVISLSLLRRTFELMFIGNRCRQVSTFQMNLSVRHKQRYIQFPLQSPILFVVQCLISCMWAISKEVLMNLKGTSMHYEFCNTSRWLKVFSIQEYRLPQYILLFLRYRNCPETPTHIYKLMPSIYQS